MRSNEEFVEALKRYLDHANQVVKAAKLFRPSKVVLRSPGRETLNTTKYVVLDHEQFDEDGKLASRSVFAFIAAKDVSTKSLGDVKQGDILKPATWKAPAKHARGNLFDAFNGTMGADGATPLEWTGPHYL